MEQKHMSGKAALKIVVGSILAAYGLTLAVYAGFGGATLAIFWQGVANLTGLTIGGASLAVAVVMLAFVFFYDRRQIHIGTVIYQLFYSGFVEIFSRLHVYSQSRILNFIIMCAGIVVFSFGTGLYSSENLGRGSYEGREERLAGEIRPHGAGCAYGCAWCALRRTFWCVYDCHNYNSRAYHPVDGAKVLKGKIFVSYPVSFP